MAIATYNSWRQHPLARLQGSVRLRLAAFVLPEGHMEGRHEA
jgi:hypothetical protein